MYDPIKIVTVGSFVAWSVSTITFAAQSRHSRGRIRLDESNTSEATSIDQEDADDISHYKKNLDGYAINVQQCKRRIHRSRIALCVESLAALALSLAQLIDLFPWKEVTWRDAIDKPDSWPLLAFIATWLNIFLFSLRSMQNGRHWNSVLHIAALTTALMLACVTLLVIPGAVKQGQIPYYGAQLLLIFIALSDSITIPSGPRRVKDTSKGTIPMARFSDKGQTVMSLLWFTNAWDVVKIARRKGRLDEHDIPQMGSDFDSVALHAKFSECYERSRRASGSRSTSSKFRFQTLHDCWQIFTALFAANRKQFIANQILAACMGFAFYIPSYVSLRIVRFLEDIEKDGQKLSSVERLRFGFPYCLLLVSAILFTSLGLGQLFRLCMATIRNRIRAQLQMAIFSKALRRKDISEVNELSQTPEDDDKDKKGAEDAAASFSKTQIFNLVSVDTERVTNVTYLIIFSMAPVEIMVGGFFAIYLLRWGAVIGLASSFLLQPIIFLVGKIIARIQGRLQGVRDRKTSLLNEIIQAIRMVKFNAWEEKVSARVQVLRDEELRYQRLVYLTESLQGFVFHLSPLMVTIIAYAWLTLVEKQPLRPSVAFAAFAVLDEMRFSLTQIPEGISQIIQTFVSLARIQTYLESDEVNVSTSLQKQDLHDNVRLVDATVRWPIRSQGLSKSATPPTRNSVTTIAFKLVGINVHFTAERLNVIVGRLGAGKTLLLEALLGEAEVLSGQILCPRSVANSIRLNMTIKAENWLRSDQTAFVPQSAFLVNASIKDNILFGLPMSEDRYEATLSGCCLRPDLAIFEDGDETEIGENGIGLSGGQTARVMLARAIYGRACTLILDDPLSAVDSHTAEELCALFRGPLCHERTIILVTHQVQLVAPISARVLMLDAGRVVYNDEPMAFMQSDLYSGLIEEQEQEEKQENKPSDTAESSTTATPSATAPPSPTLVAAKSIDGNIGDEQLAKVSDSVVATKKQPKKLVEEEKRATGAILLSIYGQYVNWAGGLPVALATVAVFAAANGFQIVVKRWLQYWSNDVLQGLGNPDARQHTDQWWLIGWSAIMLLDLILETSKNLILVFSSLRASNVMFRALLAQVLRAPLRFHDTVSRGRLLNRFSYDCQEVDSELVDTVERFGDQGLMIVVTVYSITEGGGWPFLLFFACMVPLYAGIGRLYMLAQRDMKRLSSTSRSPILNQFGDIVRGASVIRAFGAPAYFTQKLVERINENVSYNVWMMELRYWYEELFNSVSFWVMMVATIFVLLNTSISASQAGFIFTFLINAHIHILFFLQAYTNLEQKLVSVERIVEYSKLDSEVVVESKGRLDEGSSSRLDNWPKDGQISVQDLHVRYAADLPEVLKGVTFQVPSAAKVGVVGATGSGKSTLASAFFRFAQITKGSIEIDGIDIQNVNLYTLRSRLQIVPQDPMIFSGPLRATLDVFEEFSDEQVLHALRQVQLIGNDGDEDYDGRSLSDGGNQKRDFSDLTTPISESGSNLSQGEKQLLCLARAILRQSKVILFDEATSSVDFDTDKLISQTIREAFKQSTIITIAHRLRTIIDYDFVLVLDSGKVAEFARPIELLQNPSSRFYKLCRAAGKRELAHLKRAAGVMSDV